MTMHKVKDNGLFELKREAREALGTLSPPGAPDEAWRRLPPEVLDGFMEPAFGRDINPGHFELQKTGPGRLKKITVDGEGASGDSNSGGGKSTGGIGNDAGGSTGSADSDAGGTADEGVIGRWVAIERSRQALRLERANDVEENLLSALHLAYTDSLHYLHFDTHDAAPDTPTEIEIRLTEAGEAEVYLPFLIVEAAAGTSAELRLRIRHEGNRPVRGIFQVVFLLEAGSHVKYSYSEEGGPEDVWFSFEKSYQAENSRLHFGHSHASAGVSMRDSRHAMLGRGARFETYTLAQPGDEGFAGQKISVEHYSPFTMSNVETRSVLGGSANSVFVGSIKIPEGAAGSEGYEEHKSLLLSPTARVQSLPELEIVENDVQCSHASTVMEPEEEEIFYLGSRGISPGEARELLTGAFVRQVQSRMPGYQREVNEDE